MITKNSFSLLVFLLLLLHLRLSLENLSFDYIFQFGDSINDTGNFEWDDPLSDCAKLPYGRSLRGGSPRCSDGLLMVDYFAEFLGLPISPYLEKGADFRHGVNFAVAGSTALNASAFSPNSLLKSGTKNSLSIQLDWFRSHLNFVCRDSPECKRKVLRKALVIMGEIGGNDYNYAIQRSNPVEELTKIVPEVIRTIKAAVEELISVGATTLIVPGNFVIGCVPIWLAAFETSDPTMYDELHCLKGFNAFAKFHNDRLQEAIKELQEQHPHVTIVYGDYYSAHKWVLKNADALGFSKDELQRACCGTGANRYNFDVTRMCGNGVPVCADPNKLMSWDGIHFTQHAYFHMAQWLMRDMAPSLFSLRCSDCQQ